MKDTVKQAYRNATARADTQGARVMRAEEYQALMYAIEACRRFTNRQSRESYNHALMALQLLGTAAGWDRD